MVNRTRHGQRATESSASRVDWLASIPLLPKPDLRIACGTRSPNSSPVTTTRFALPQSRRSLRCRHNQDETFELIAPFVSERQLRKSAVETLLRIPPKSRSTETSAKLLATLVDHAEQIPAAERTTDPFIDSMQLADQLLAAVPSDQARKFRNRLREVFVRVVKIKTVEEEMRYDIPYFAVEAGRPVQILARES